MKFISRAVASFASKGGLETQGNPRNSLFKKSVVPAAIAVLLGVGAYHHMSAEAQAPFSMSGASSPVELADGGDVRAAIDMMNLTEGGERLFPNASARQGHEVACLNGMAGLQGAEFAFMSTDAIAGVEGAAMRFGLSERQNQHISRFSALMNLADCLKPFGEQAGALLGVDERATDIAMAYRAHLSEAHAVAVATLALAREGEGTDTALLFSHLRAVRTALLSGSNAGDRSGSLGAINSAALESSSVVGAAIRLAMDTPQDVLGRMTLAEISGHARRIADTYSHSPDTLVHMAKALADTRHAQGEFVVHPDLPDTFKQILLGAQVSTGFTVDSRDGVPSVNSMPPRWAEYGEMGDELGEVTTCSLSPATVRAVTASLARGERLVSCGPLADDGTREYIAIDRNWDMRIHKADASMNLEDEPAATAPRR